MSGLKRLAISAAAVLVAVSVVAYLFLSRTEVELEPWHLLHLEEEFTADMASTVTSFDDYLVLEDRLFDELDAALSDQERAPLLISRYHPDSPTNPVRFPVDWNRTFQLAPDPGSGSAAGAVLLLHGLSDSPYSLRWVAELLRADGFDVVGVRLPGHGTIPAGISSATVEDWRAAVLIAAEEVARRAGPSSPMIVVGYSTGAALALDYAIQALDDPLLRVPDRLVLLSPGLAAPAAARLAIWQTRLSRLPGLEHLAWLSTLPEYDPFKYNSFPVFAADQYYRLTEHLEEGLAGLDAAGRRDELPPVLVAQSAVDDTVPPLPSLSRLFDRLLFNRSELILFDANRLAYIEELLNPKVDELRTWLGKEGHRAFSATVVTNFGTDQAETWALTWRTHSPDAGAEDSAEIALESLGIEWPPGIYSLSHVAVPFPPWDPVYGVDTSLGPPFPLGLLELRGERELLVIPQTLLARMRYNPFFPYLEDRLLSFARGEVWEDVLDREGMFEPQEAQVTFVNESETTIVEFYFDEDFRDSWTDDMLAGETLAPGEALDLSHGDYCWWDIRVVLADGRDIELDEVVNFCDREEIVFRCDEEGCRLY